MSQYEILCKNEERVNVSLEILHIFLPALGVSGLLLPQYFINFHSITLSILSKSQAIP
jgi:hypothetical protein